MEQANPQWLNIGNRGDIYKHAAWQYCLERLARTSGYLRIIETHAFQIEGTVRDHSSFNVDRAALRGRGYEEYFALQEEYVDKGAYLCSAGIACDVLCERQERELIFFEADAGTRAQLAAQLGAREVSGVEVMGDCLADVPWPKAERLGHVLALVDPFGLDHRNGEGRSIRSSWEPLLARLERYAGEGCVMGLLLFQFEKNVETTTQWPSGLGQFEGPVLQLSDDHYRLAAYGNAAFFKLTAAWLERQGWVRNSSE